MWFEGKVHAVGLGTSSGYLGRLVVESSPVTLHSLAATTTFTLSADLDHRQLQIIEEHRTGAIKFNLEVTGTAMRDGNLERIGLGSIEYEINQSNWAAIVVALASSSVHCVANGLASGARAEVVVTTARRDDRVEGGLLRPHQVDQNLSLKRLTEQASYFNAQDDVDAVGADEVHQPLEVVTDFVAVGRR